jgi:predicted RecB family nuclease
MRLLASDIIALHRPTPCELRIYLRHNGTPEAAPGPFDEVLRRLGMRHEEQHLNALGATVDLSRVREQERIQETLKSIAANAPVIYQPAFLHNCQIDGIDVTVVGTPDFLILDGDNYRIRDSKLSLHIDEDQHPEILLQVQAYGWLYEKSCGRPPKAIEVHAGTGVIVSVPYDGGVAALHELRRILTLKRLTTQPYEPVGWSKCGGCGFYDSCWKAAVNVADISLIPDVDQSLARALRHDGVIGRKDLLKRFDVVALGEYKRPRGDKMVRVGNAAERILLQAEVLEQNQERVLTSPGVPNIPNYVMFDLEGMPPHLNEIDKIYLWGMQVFGDKPSKFRAAVSGFGPDGDQQGWKDFLKAAKDILLEYGDLPFVHWASYEKTYISKYIKRYGDPDGIAARILANLCDLLPITRNSLVLPLPSYSLKVVEEHVGFKRTQDEYGGAWAMATFIEATETQDKAKRDELMGQILTYNEEDLAATWAVLEWLRSRKPAAAATSP